MLYLQLRLGVEHLAPTIQARACKLSLEPTAMTLLFNVDMVAHGAGKHNSTVMSCIIWYIYRR